MSIFNRFSALEIDSDSDSDTCYSCGSDSDCETSYSCGSPAAPRINLLDDPLMQAMARGDILWGDLLYEASPVVQEWTLPERIQTPPKDDMELWELPQATNLAEYYADHYDTRKLSDSEWEAVMSWIHAAGWTVGSWDRKGFHAVPDNGPAVVWTKPVPKTAAVPRFCRNGASCTDSSCRFVHGDTIPRTNRPCAFGASCGKRESCLYLHPGEIWSVDLVLKRPICCGGH